MKKIIFIILALFLCAGGFAFAEDGAKPSSGELINKCWQAHGKKDIETTFKYTQELIGIYKDQADKFLAQHIRQL